MIYCSIDLMDGKAVQLVQGNPENKKLEVSDVWGLAEKFSQIGPINVIDLDAALGKGENTELICALAKKFPIRVGGGIRTVEKAEAYIAAGAEKIIIGSKALDIEFMKRLVSVVPKEKIIIAIDSFKDEIVVQGWKVGSKLKTEEMISVLEPYCSGFLYTQVEKEGLMRGPDFERLGRLRQLTDLSLIAAGGISSLEEIAALDKDNIDSVLGMALYIGKIDFDSLLEYSEK